jgi:glycosyltransferase involved in cell wall biosynthesis
MSRAASSGSRTIAHPRYGIVWEGSQLGLHSFAQVNRELCLRLIERGHDLDLVSSEIPDEKSPAFPGRDTLLARFKHTIGGPVIAHVRHTWPPNFAPPLSGHWVLIQPWEFGSLPKSWVGPESDGIDEFWAYSRFVRDCYIKSGVSADRVHVVPLGVDTSRFHPQAQPLPVRTTKTFKFLFVGGTIHRKGIDILLNAFVRAFTANDPVCLVIKDVGSASFYRQSNPRDQIEKIRAQSGAPEIVYLDQELSSSELAGLYTACNCLVHPYRGEGFGLPIAEAMASGLPVIVTEYGAALDYCTAENAYLIPARIMRFRHKRIGALETVDIPWLAEADPAALVALMRHVVDHQDEAQAKGSSAADHIQRFFTWERSIDVIETRLAQLARVPIRRSAAFSEMDAAAEPERAPITDSPAPRAPTPARRRRVSLCMIVRNETAHLAACLASVADLVDEIVVVDTGSTDGTPALAARFGARVFEFSWVDSFAAARNESLRHATGEWIFWLDADESLDQENRAKLKALFDGLSNENAAYLMKQRSPSRSGALVVVADQLRLFRRQAGAHWSYRVHEQILPALRRTGVNLRRSDIVIEHSGQEDARVRRQKLDRDLRLLLLDHADRPDDPFTLFNLGALYEETGRLTEALPLLKRSLAGSRPTASIVPKLYALIAQCERRLGQAGSALRTCQAARELYPEDAEIHFIEALLQRELGDPAGAETTLLRLLARPAVELLANGDPGLRGFKARHNLAVIYHETGRTAQAEAQWRAAVAENPSFSVGWVRLAELYLAQGRWSDLEAAALSLARCPGGSAKADLLRARGLSARRDLGGASLGPTFDEAIHQGADAVRSTRSGRSSARPRVSLCMIVRDEEARLPACLSSVADLVDEMIVVDTGSRDRTREVAAAAGARVVDYVWADDFAAARNESIRHATGDWIFWLDADERLDQANREMLRGLLESLCPENAAYLMQQLSSTDDPYGSKVAVDHVRLFRRDDNLRWEYRVHEQILLSIRRAGHDLRRTDVIIDHAGFEQPGHSERKLERNFALLTRQDAERPNDPITLYHLGLILDRLGRTAAALPVLRRSLERAPADYSMRPRLFAAIAEMHRKLGDPAQALAFCRAGREQHPLAGELLFLEASLLHDAGELEGAEKTLLSLLGLNPGLELRSGDAGRETYKARHLLAQVYLRQGRPALAAAEWRRVLAEQPRFIPARQGLSELSR